MKLGKNRLAIRPDVVSQVSGAGLVIPEGSREKPDRGTVIAVGDGSVWSVGDKVSFPKHLGFTTEDAEG
jgi:co-chaperonin GroES (HSP10)